MSDAPERIWACASKNTKSGVVTLLGDATFPVDGWQEYVRADAIAALAEQLAAARRDAEEAEAYAGELEKERDEQIEWVKRLADDLIAAEAKLAKAVELALKECPFRWGTPRYDKWWQDRRTIIAELTGGKDE